MQQLEVLEASSLNAAATDPTSELVGKALKFVKGMMQGITPADKLDEGFMKELMDQMVWLARHPWRGTPGAGVGFTRGQAAIREHMTEFTIRFGKNDRVPLKELEELHPFKRYMTTFSSKQLSEWCTNAYSTADASATERAAANAKKAAELNTPKKPQSKKDRANSSKTAKRSIAKGFFGK